MVELETEPFTDLQTLKGVSFPASVKFLQILVTGPPGAGKSTLIRSIGGWSEEGYLDLTRKRWWADQALAIRPREIHLGFPFVGFDHALSVFDQEWIDAFPHPELEAERILMPPPKLHPFAPDWRSRYVFEFLLPTPKALYEQRAERSRLKTHPVDEEIDRALIKAQLAVFQQTALYLYLHGLPVYVREGTDGPPLKIRLPPGARIEPELQCPDQGAASRLFRLFPRLIRCPRVKLREPRLLRNSGVRIPFEGFPLELVLGPNGKRLQLYPELPLQDSDRLKTPRSYMVLDPAREAHEFAGFLRLSQGKRLHLGTVFREQIAYFGLSGCVADMHAALKLDRDTIAVRDTSGVGTWVAPTLSEHRRHRLARLRRLREIFGGPLEPLPPETALALIEKVLKSMKTEKYRERDSQGRPGGLLCLPPKINPIIVGDLHAKIDNLLVLISQNGFLEGLEQGSAALLFLGDAVHRDAEGHFEEMESSMLMMDLIFRLKETFPNQVFYLRGNHDSFSDDVAKGGIPQGLLWASALRASRGKAYAKAMERFYEQLPYVAVAKDFVACHAAPPKTKIDRDMLVNIRRYPGLILELINNRIYRPNRPAGYTNGDIKRFRKTLKVPSGFPVIVGHTLVDHVNSVWLNAGGFQGHHIIYGSQPDWIAAFTRIGDHLTPLSYPAEPLVSLVNSMQDDLADPGPAVL
jgi:energy-coupling factor transporter ATP-binding protein EcfA2